MNNNQKLEQHQININNNFSYQNKKTKIISDPKKKKIIANNINDEIDTLITNYLIEFPHDKIDELKGHVILKLNTLKNTLKASENNNYEILETELEKIISLKLIEIPLGNSNKIYYTFTGTTEGATAKTCLISPESLIKKLEELQSISIEKLKDYKGIKENAFLKHPKHNKRTEVQREAIALEIAKILGFENITENTMVNHKINNKFEPCLFIPFGEMNELTGALEQLENNEQPEIPKNLKAKLKQEYVESVEDFGKYLAYFAICCDPDFIGKNGQNKGLTKAKEGEVKKLYIFDQVFMSENNFILNQAFNVKANSLLRLGPDILARHFIGRNKSIINDSNFEEKIGSVINLIQKKDEIINMFNSIIKSHSNYIKSHNDKISKLLKNDATECLKVFKERIGEIEKLLPQIKIAGKKQDVPNFFSNPDNKEHINLLKKTMLINQLINKPKLFDQSGKPYRAPFVETISPNVDNINFTGENIVISFPKPVWGSALSDRKKNLLIEQGFTISNDGSSATISKTKLKNLNVSDFFIEKSSKIDTSKVYFDKNILKNLAETYNESAVDINSLSKMQTLDQIDNLNIKNLGFKEHVKLCFICEKIKNLILKNDKEPEKAQNIQEAYKNTKSVQGLEDILKKFNNINTSQFKPAPTDNNISDQQDNISDKPYM